MIGIDKCEICHGNLMESFTQYSFAVKNTTVTVTAVPTFICTRCSNKNYSPEVKSMLSCINSALLSRGGLPDCIVMNYGEDPFAVGKNYNGVIL